MKEIKLTQGRVALVDDEDFDYLNQWKWYAAKHRKKYWYAQRMNTKNGAREILCMHRIILKIYDSSLVDHKDHDTLNNQRNNLRIASFAQNSANRNSHKGSSSKYLGVSWDNKVSKWRARIMAKGVGKHVGLFVNETEAANAYNQEAIKIHGEFANLNKIVV